MHGRPTAAVRRTRRTPALRWVGGVAGADRSAGTAPGVVETVRLTPPPAYQTAPGPPRLAGTPRHHRSHQSQWAIRRSANSRDEAPDVDKRWRSVWISRILPAPAPKMLI